MDDAQDYGDERPEDELKEIDPGERQPPEAPGDSQKGRREPEQEGGAERDGESGGNAPSAGQASDPGTGEGP